MPLSLVWKTTNFLKLGEKAVVSCSIGKGEKNATQVFTVTVNSYLLNILKYSVCISFVQTNEIESDSSFE